MNDLKQLLQALDIGVAVVDLETWAVLFENASAQIHPEARTRQLK